MINFLIPIALLFLGSQAAAKSGISDLRKKRLLTKQELLRVIYVVKSDYPATAVIPDDVALGVAYTESGKLLNGIKVFDNQAYRAGGGIDYSLGIMQLIKPTAEGMYKRYPTLPKLTGYDSAKKVYSIFSDPYVSMSYGLLLLATNYRSLQGKTNTPLNEAIKAYNTGMGNRNSATGANYLNKVVTNMNALRVA